MSEQSSQKLRIATRASQLALWQAHHIAGLLQQLDKSLDVEIVHISTHGDRDQSEPLSNMGGTGVFTKEVQNALLEQQADIAVHSLKDLPTEQTPRLQIAAVPKREIVYDALVLPQEHDSLDADSPLEILPEGAKVGTGSLRRQAQLLHHRPDLELLEIRGNVDTRLRKLDEGQYDAIILAAAGLTRLDGSNRISSLFKPPVMYPAVGQGALGLECREDDDTTRDVLSKLIHPEAMAATSAERAMLRTLRAGCHAPVGVYVVTNDDNSFEIEGVVLSRDGKSRISATTTGNSEKPDEAGIEVAEKLLADGASELIEN